MAEKKEPKRPARPYRISFDSNKEFKGRLESQAQARGFDSYKNYIIHLVEKDRDILAGLIEEKPLK